MRLRTVIWLGTAVSVLLFCLAVGYYAFMHLDMTNRNRSINLFSMVPANCAGVLESDNITAYLNEVPTLNYGMELERFQFPGLFCFILGELNEYTTRNAHGLSSQMNRLVVSFHQPCGPRDQVIYFQMGTADETVFTDMLREYTSGNFLPKEEKYRGKTIQVYPLNYDEYLSVYTESGFFVVSYQKKLVEEVIDAKLDGTSLNEDAVFPLMHKAKRTDYLTLYARSSAMPCLNMEEEGWTEFDFHLNSDVFYLTGETYLSEPGNGLALAMERIKEAPHVKGEHWLMSADKDSIQYYMENAYRENESQNRTLFNECVANLSYDASFSLVTDMQHLSQAPQELQGFLPAFVQDNSLLFSAFYLSVQYSCVNDRLSHIWVFTYKN